MRSKHNGLKPLAFLALAALGSSASALTFTIASAGSYTVSGSVYTFTESVIYQTTNPVSVPFTSVTLTLDTNTWNGTAFFTEPSAIHTLLVNYTLDPPSMNMPFAAASGNWSYVTGTGDYLAASGFGTLTQNADTAGISSLSSFKGTLTPVPEPMTMAALGVGALAVLRRRKRTV